MARFQNQAYLFSDARRELMLPENEIEALYEAYLKCTDAFEPCDFSRLSAEAKDWVQELKALLDLSAEEASGSEGKIDAWAKRLSPEKKKELVELIDDLATYFDRECEAHPDEDE